MCVHGVAPAYLSDLCVSTTAMHLRSSASAICSDLHSAGSTRPDCNWTTKFRSQRTSHVEPSATSTTVTGPVRERLQAGIEDAPVLDHTAPLRHLHNSGAGYNYPDLLTYFLASTFQHLRDDVGLEEGQMGNINKAVSVLRFPCLIET